MEIMKGKVSMPVVKDLIDDIEKYRGPLDKLKDNSEIKRKVKALNIADPRRTRYDQSRGNAERRYTIAFLAGGPHESLFT